MSQRMVFENFEIRVQERTLLVGGQPVRLGGRAFDVLLVLAQHRDRFLSLEALRDAVLGFIYSDGPGPENLLTVQISVLRRLLGRDAIVSVPGLGYRLAANPVVQVASQTSGTPTRGPGAPGAALEAQPDGDRGTGAASGNGGADAGTAHAPPPGHFDGPSPPPVSAAGMPPPVRLPPSMRMPGTAGAEPPPWAGAEPPAPGDSPAAAGSAPPEAGAEPPMAGSGAPDTPPPAPVLLAASAPRECNAGSSCTASLAVYVEAAKASALRRLEQLGEVGDRVVDDVAPDGDARWRVGAPITVRLAGPHLKVTPPERRFEWNGRENVAAFSVEVDATAPAGRVQLCFQVELAGVPMAYIPMGVAIAPSAPAAATAAAAPAAAAPTAVAAPTAPPAQTQATLPRSVFASYASKDAALVTQRLSTLARWDPGLDIFEDCLDLEPNAEFSAQLERQIRTRDTFALFWSRNAAASKWVRWEYELRLKARGIESIVPMPLEDPAIVPPPTEFADTHWRDRFMLAGYALAAIREQAQAATATPAAPAPAAAAPTASPPPAPPAG